MPLLNSGIGTTNTVTCSWQDAVSGLGWITQGVEWIWINRDACNLSVSLCVLWRSRKAPSPTFLSVFLYLQHVIVITGYVVLQLYTNKKYKCHVINNVIFCI